MPLLGCAIGPLLHSAQASRRAPTRDPVQLHAEQHRDVPGSVTLAEMIEIQRFRRARAAMPVSTSAAWEAQFGAFTAAEPAARLQAALQARVSAVAVQNRDGLYRVVAAAADQSGANAICTKVGAACFVRER